jgi:hypothetical protein
VVSKIQIQVSFNNFFMLVFLTEVSCNVKVNHIFAFKQHLLLAVGSDGHLNTIDESAMGAVVYQVDVFRAVEDGEVLFTQALVLEVAIRVLAKSDLSFAQVNCKHIENNNNLI